MLCIVAGAVIAPLLLIAVLCIVAGAVIARLLLIAVLCIVAGAAMVPSFTPGCFAGSVSLLTYTAYQSYCLLYG
ncbi:hypothetical protein A9W96_02500 [Mycobacterium sp. 1245852.3]|nr:hypothetical protein A9W96_02500 [Mycobacterium sp. 1245852.3]